ncbi:superoxide dismutase [Novosphingobium bradum]|uniref:superoxide dismutase n=1 Tax=Novosphingobium bradum TaxID=1737444 RepID=A0ABV7IQW3_9SPHN
MTRIALDRRELIATGAALGAGALFAAPGAAAQPVAASAPSPSPSYAPQPVPLGFDPAGIAGLSERLLVSHHDNNYLGAVKRLAGIEGELAALDPATAPGYRINGLKREELLAWNSMVLHEIYFSQFGRPGGPTGPLAAAIAHGFGSEARWRAEFSGMGKALGGGSGWVILAWSPRDRRLVNTWAADHTMTLAGATPLLVLDMYEHAYALDYGARAAAYVDAVMAALDWRAAERRFAALAG